MAKKSCSYSVREHHSRLLQDRDSRGGEVGGGGWRGGWALWDGRGGQREFHPWLRLKVVILKTKSLKMKLSIII